VSLYACTRTGHLATLLALLLVAGCSGPEAPPCPLESSAEAARSAGCFAVKEGALLVVEGMNGKLSPPGGSVETGEGARCAAFRETWEETGLRLQPGELVDVFETGFHLYYCAHHENSGKIDPPPRMEVRRAFYLPLAEFDQWSWRFPGQEQILSSHLRRFTSPAGPATPESPPAVPETR